MSLRKRIDGLWWCEYAWCGDNWRAGPEHGRMLLRNPRIGDLIQIGFDRRWVIIEKILTRANADEDFEAILQELGNSGI